MMLAQARPIPTMGTNNNHLLVMSGNIHMLAAASARHTAWTTLGPKRRVNGTMAKAAASQSDFDLVLLDVMLPRVDGFTVLRTLRPARFVEIGSGHSSCVTLDTRQYFLDPSMHTTFIEPYPQLLQSLLRPEDRATTTLLAQPLQEVDLAVFAQLREDDVLFIDSTHVGKIGSDVNRLLFATPDGRLAHYDKRHLFRMAREHERYAGGSQRLIVDLKGWRICPLICYDLRFPVWIRNRYNRSVADRFDYDYYRDHHMTSLIKLYGREGIARIEMRKGLSSPDGTRPPLPQARQR